MSRLKNGEGESFPKIIPELRGGGGKKKTPLLVDRVYQPFDRMSWVRGKLAYHEGDHGVPSPARTVFDDIPGDGIIESPPPPPPPQR